MKHVLNESEAAQALRISPSTLRRWRQEKRGPIYLKLGKAVRYCREDIEAYGVMIDTTTTESERRVYQQRPSDGRVDVTVPEHDPRSFEAFVRDQLIAEGWDVYRNGWPDFLLVHPDGRVRAVEVKGVPDPIPAHQVRAHEALRAAGVQVDVVRVARSENCSVDCSVTTPEPPKNSLDRKVA